VPKPTAQADDQRPVPDLKAAERISSKLVKNAQFKRLPGFPNAMPVPHAVIRPAE
jgi:ActR/RegA family two-component response regulator